MQGPSRAGLALGAIVQTAQTGQGRPRPDLTAIQSLVGRARRRIRGQWALEGAVTATVLAAAAAAVVIFAIRAEFVERGTGIALLVGATFLRGLERRLSSTGYQLTRMPTPTYMARYFSGYFDFVTSTGFVIDDLVVLPQGKSDHLPISLTARIAA